MFTEPPTLGGVSGSGAPGFSAMPSHSAMHDVSAMLHELTCLMCSISVKHILFVVNVVVRNIRW